MADLVPAAHRPPALPALDQLKRFAAQPAMRRLVPYFLGLASLGMLALTWAVLSPAPQRLLYSSLDDAERASVTAALEQAGIAYSIDNDTGAMTVDEDELYRARMTVASQGALAMPEDGTQLIDTLPIGASRTLEGDRLRAARERELQLTIVEIDGVQAARVHLAQAQESVFVRESNPPTASVMLRLASGKSLSDGQVQAISSLVAASVPGLDVGNVRVVDQHGRLLSSPGGQDTDELDLQARTEARLRSNVSQLLTPMFGAGNFSTEIAVVLDRKEVTSARETYDRDGAIRREVTSQVAGPAGSGNARGIPGATSNLPPAKPVAEERAPRDTRAGTPEQAQPFTGQSNASRTYELGRELAVSSSRPGGVEHLSVAVALNKGAVGKLDRNAIASLESLVSAAVGADPQRGDRVAVMVHGFEAVEIEEAGFWETPWFASLMRNGAALAGVILVLIFGVRPLFKLLRTAAQDDAEAPDGEGHALPFAGAGARNETPAKTAAPDSQELTEQVELARRIAREQPDDALQALRRMLASDDGKARAA